MIFKGNSSVEESFSRLNTLKVVSNVPKNRRKTVGSTSSLPQYSSLQEDHSQLQHPEQLSNQNSNG